MSAKRVISNCCAEECVGDNRCRCNADTFLFEDIHYFFAGEVPDLTYIISSGNVPDCTHIISLGEVSDCTHIISSLVAHTHYFFRRGI